MSDDVVSDIQRQYLVDLADKGRRFDDRGLDEYRDVSIETDVINQAEGSAHVRLGGTEVYCGVKMEMGDPYSDSPNQGVITTTAERNQMASPDFEGGPPRGPSVEVSRVIDRGIRESDAVPLESLCIEPGEKCWVVYLDVHCVDFDGNLFDAGSLGLLAALMTAQIPNHRHDLGEPEPLEIRSQPIMTTAVKIGDEILFDPTDLEEKVSSPRISVSTDEHGRIRAAQKSLAGGFQPEEIQETIRRSRRKAEELRSNVLETVKK
ncbi:RNA-binding protein [Thermoplasmatales archaeon SW_10_69_26]|nr:MAG: RNA-binding protein [Thermoplasmatales archaeon SW_10_69_26]